MSFFYFDESIQTRGGFIVGAWVYSQSDLTPAVFDILQDAGLQPGRDEYKSGTLTHGQSRQIEARYWLKNLFVLAGVRVGMTLVPVAHRDRLGEEALDCLMKLVDKNEISQPSYAFLDQGIHIDRGRLSNFSKGIMSECSVFVEQDSRSVGGIQVADLAAHSLGLMLLEQQGYIQKSLTVGKDSGYEPDIEITLGFELWATLRHAFFRSPDSIDPDGDVPDSATYDVENYGLHIAPSCSDSLRAAAIERFGRCYLGCIH